MSGTWRKVRTQAELDAVLRDGDYADCVGAGYFDVSGSATVSASGSATVRASDSATVSASGSATVSASGSATVRASDSATVSASGSATVSASGSATVRAWDSATVSASGSATVRATPYVAIQRLSMRSTVHGGVVIDLPDLTDPKVWVAYYGLDVKRGYVTVYKGLNDQYLSGYGTSYAPGSKPSAPDFKATNECGAGLHFSPRPEMTRAYCDPVRFVACKVKVADLVPIGDVDGADKCKAPSCVVLYECDEDGVEVAATVEQVAS